MIDEAKLREIFAAEGDTKDAFLVELRAMTMANANLICEIYAKTHKVELNEATEHWVNVAELRMSESIQLVFDLKPKIAPFSGPEVKGS